MGDWLLVRPGLSILPVFMIKNFHECKFFICRDWGGGKWDRSV